MLTFRITVFVTHCLLLATPLVHLARAQDGPAIYTAQVRPKTDPARGRTVWIASVAALAAANVADARTSWNKGESNRVLAGGSGGFGPRGALIKGGVNGVWIVSQVIGFRKSPRYRTAAIVNFAAAAVFGALAHRNCAIPAAAR